MRSKPPNADLPSLLSSWRAVFRVAWRASPGGALVTTFGWFVVAVVAGPMLAIALQRVVGSRGFASPVWLVVLVLGVLLPEVLLSITDHIREIVRRRGEQLISNEIIRAAARPYGIEHLENPLFADRVAFLRGEAAQIATVFGTVAGQVGLLLGFLLSVAVLVSVSWWLLLPVVGGTVLGAMQLRAARWALSVREGALTEQRLADHLVRLATTAQGAPDIRMLGMGTWLLRRYDRSTSVVGQRLLRSERRGVITAAGAGAGQALMLMFGLGVLLWLAGYGRVSPGGVILGVALLQTVLESARGLAMNGAFAVRSSFAARRYLWVLGYSGGVRQPERPTDPPERLNAGLRLSGVSFRYPFTEREVLHDVSITLRPGSVVALVGDNGAGKSTLIKLLCRFYDPTAGRITVDDLDLRSLDLDRWRASITAGFQDFARFEFRAEESIGASRVELLDEVRTDAAARTASIVRAAQAGGADEFLGRLPDGYETQLGRQFGGAQLSEGQWQRVAMARAFLREAPLLMLLDEPTAALDPRAEHELFERHTELTTAARARGAVTVLVSHRYSTVRMADHIVVLEDGRVAQEGDHDTLVARDGPYRRSFEAQARRYQDTTQPQSADPEEVH